MLNLINMLVISNLNKSYLQYQPKKEVYTHMTNHSQLPISVMKINDQFRKQIRKRDIDSRLTQRRTQLLHEFSHPKKSLPQTPSTYYHPIPTQTTEDSTKILLQFQTLYHHYTTNKYLTESQYQILAAISCTITGAKTILDVQIEFIISIINQAILNPINDDTPHQKYALVVLSNCLAVTDVGYKTENQLKYSIFNTLTTHPIILSKLFSLSLHSLSPHSRQHALNCIFIIIYNNDDQFAQQLILNPTYTIIDFLTQHLQGLPSKQQTIQIYSIFYILMKKNRFQQLPQFSKMEGFIVEELKCSNHSQIVNLAIICLHALLQCLPGQKTAISESGILKQIFTHSLTENNIKTVLYSLRITTILLQQKKQTDIKYTVSFIQSIINQFTHDGTLIVAFKTLHNILNYTHYNFYHLTHCNHKLFSKMMELFLSNLTSRDILRQISSILVTIDINDKNIIDNQLAIQIKKRIQEILANSLFDQATHHYLFQQLSIFDHNSQISCL